MKPWSYLSHVHNCRIMLEADKGGGSGGGGGGKKTEAKTDLEQLTEAKDEIKALNGRAETAAADLKAEQEKALQLSNDLKAAQEKADQLGKDLAAANEKLTTAANDLKAEQQKTEQLGKDLAAEQEKVKTTDERTEQRLREVDAQNGGTLPPKKVGAGDHTQEQADDKKSPQDTLASIFNKKRQ